MVRWMIAAAVLGVLQMPVTRVTEGQLRPLPVTQLDPGAAAAALDSPRRVTLSFVEPRPIDEVLHLLVTGTPFSLAVDPDVGGSFRGELRDLSLRDALTTLLAPLGLEFTVEGTTLRVTRRRTETRQFDLNVLDVQRGLKRTSGAQDAVVTTTVVAEDVYASIGDGVRALLSEAGRVHVDRRAGLATVTDFPERLERVALYLETLHVRSTREVRLQAQAYEVTLRAPSGIDWGAVRQKLGVPADAPTAGLAADADALRAALAAQGDIRTVWAPEITALNNEPALVRLDTPGPTSLTLTVVPQIASDGAVLLAIAHSWREQSGDVKEGSSESDTVSRVASGSAVVIGGLLRPLQAAKQFGYAELVVVIRPTIVAPGTKD
jgi:MSHA biogenesis protein MshL